MANISLRDRFTQLVMTHERIPEDAKRELVNAFNAVRRTSPRQRADDEWAALTNDIRRARLAISSNKSHWNPDLAPLMQEYIDALSETISLVGLSAAAHATIDECAAERAKLNKQRAEEGRPLVSARNHRWQTWINPSFRQDLCLRVEAVYNGSRKTYKGKRFKPFQPHYERALFDARRDRVAKAINNLRNAANDSPHPHQTSGSTPYRALILAACRQADIALTQITRRLDAGAIALFEALPLIPVNWRALLSPEMRDRLRDAAEAPNLVDPEGLASFYAPIPGYGINQANEFAPTLPPDDTDVEDSINNANNGDTP